MRTEPVWDDGRDGFSYGVPYSWELAGAEGAAFYLKPVRGVHTDEDIKKAKAGLRVTRDVVYVNVEWREPC